MKLNEFIRQIRRSNALTVQQLADVLELSRSQMNRLESGESTFSLKHLHKIAETLNTDFYELVVLLVKEETGTILPLINTEIPTINVNLFIKENTEVEDD